MKRRALALLLGLLALGQTGCLTTWMDGLRFPWDEAVDTTYEAPVERMQRYRALGSKARGMQAADQERESTALAQAYQGEADPMIRASLIEALSEFQTAPARAVLAAGARDPDGHVRMAAGAAWSKRGADGVNVIGQMLQAEEDRDVRLALLRSLGETKEASAAPVLARALEDSDVAIQYRAIRSLEQVTGRYYGNDANAWRRHAQGEDVPSRAPSLAERWERFSFY